MDCVSDISELTQIAKENVSSQEESERRITSWHVDRNKRQTGIDWQVSTDDARIKLKRLYPKIGCDKRLADPTIGNRLAPQAQVNWSW